MAGNEVIIHVREQGAAATGQALGTLQTMLKGVAASAAGTALGFGVFQLSRVLTNNLTDALKGAVTAASSMNESASKSRVVFGAAADEMAAFAKDSASSMGLSTQAATEMAGTFGNLFTAMGISRGGAAEMSKGILQLGADLASFNNIPVEEALLKIRAGLVGETEPLRTLGVNLNAVAIEQEAMRLGLLKTGETLSAANKSQAAYSLILQQTKNAQGDFERTSDGLANQQRRLGAEVDNLKAKMGSALLPVVTDMTTKMAGLIEQNGEQWAKDFASGVETATEAAGKLFSILESLVKSSPFQVTLKVLTEMSGGDSGSGLAKFLAGPLGLLAHAGDNLTGIMEQLPDEVQRAVMGTEWASAHGPGLTQLDKQMRDLIIKNTPGLGGDMPFEEFVPNATSPAAAMQGGIENIANTVKAAAKETEEKMSEWQQNMNGILDEFMHKQVEAYMKGGDAAVEVVKKQQQATLNEIVSKAVEFHQHLGINLPDALKLAAEAAQMAIEAEQELARQRMSLFQATTQNLGGGNIALLNAIATGTLQEGVTYGTPGSGADVGGVGMTNYGTVNNVYPNVTAGAMAVPSTADGMVG